MTDPGRTQQRLEAVNRQLEPAYRRFQEAIKVAVEQKRAVGAAAGGGILTAVNRAEAGILAGICASIVIVVISGYCIVRAISRPLVKLTEAMESMRQGDFTGRLAVDRQDEFGELAGGFNHMADSLSALVSQVQESGIVVNCSATQLSDTARQQEGGAQETAATTVEIGATAKEISATSQDLVKTVKEVAQVAEQTTTMAGNGQSGLLRMQETMVQVMSAASGISGKLTVLNEKAGSISQVVTTITKVADQTNLLSLNAAIEAEKAGEYGRGFSVVATEIRRLADQTAVASHDIEQTVKEMQAAVSAGVMSVDKFSEEVRRGVQEVNQVGVQLNEIIRQVQALTPRFESVNEGMQMHAVGAQQISSALSQLGESTQQTVQSLRNSNCTIERLNEASSLLRNAVSQFKLQTIVPLRDPGSRAAGMSVRRNSDRPTEEFRNVDA
ncbi:MAG: methyl-accepting chemotaxis protein [Verrucomicrobia bacterium]|nr:methyl-accepting chemotaxis protein [Verrucomicrobiota bacterium]